MNPYEEALRQLKEAQEKEIDRRAERMKNLLTGDLETKKHLEKQLCKEDINHWLSNWVCVYEPRPTPRTIPYLPADFQDELIAELLDAIRNGHDLRIEKSRDMRATWTVLIVFTYLWQFHDMTFLVGSRKAEEVDKIGDLDTLLPKVRFILECQPRWLLPEGFSIDKHAGWMNILNPESKGSIGGESNNANFGTGGRRNAIFFDEYAKWEYTDSAAWTSAGANTPCRLAVSTPLFKNNRFYILLKEPIKNISLHWSRDLIKAAGMTEVDGKKTSPWYEMQKARYRPDELAQEFDISYSGTQQSSVFHEELALMRIEQRIRPVPYTQGMQVYWSFDPGIGDMWANGFYQVLGYSEEVRWFDYYENQNQPIGHYIDWVKDPERPWNKIHLDRQSGKDNYISGWKEIIVIPDPNQGTNRELASGKSLVQQLHGAGFQHVVVRPVGKLEAISETKRVFKKLWMESESEWMKLALDRISSFRYKYNERMAEFEMEPVHDINSHCADQLKYFCSYIKNPEKIMQSKEKERDQEDRILNYKTYQTGIAGY